MLARVPTALAENRYELFPTGTFTGLLSGAESRSPLDDDSWRLIRLSVSDTAPFSNEDPDTNGRGFNDDITVLTDGVMLTEVEDFTNQDIPFPIRRSAGLLAGLALAVGAATPDDNGYLNVDFASFIEALLEGTFENEEIAFEVSHYTPNKEGAETRDQFARIGPAS